MNKSDYEIGWDLFLAGRADSACENYDQLTGWYDACLAEVRAQQADRMRFRAQQADRMRFRAQQADRMRFGGSVDESAGWAIEEDYEWIRRGC